MARRCSSTLGLGGMSAEVVEAVFEYSETHSVSLMLISSKNQIDYEGDYVKGGRVASTSGSLTSCQALSPARIYVP
jgi:hypothetical protein